MPHLILTINFLPMEGLTFLSKLRIFIWPPAEETEIWSANIAVAKNNYNDNESEKKKEQLIML